MDKNASITFSGTISAQDKTEWQIGVEQQLQALADNNASLSAQVQALQAAIVSQAEACSHR
ncbi:hypothetical protein [Klebsiella sp. BIGb0407]|uniref:hypothetical protein n=1 Tax=Klebsiella sp. BIGb0407 TaxID=2940603 RepID=UPI002167303C|nr:hypothetical protein [Klebsiella sp. BIGb0407]MCS3433689.1 hypothetical protein [Klebsiella sp. BIGb0407]